MNVFKSFWNNACKTVDNVKEVGSLGVDCFKNGNIAGGILNTVIVAPTVGGANILTLGGLNAIGEGFADNIDSGEADKHDNIIDGIGDGITHCVEWAAKNEAESILIQDDLSKGVYNEYKYDDEKKCFVIDKDKDGNLKSYKATTAEQKKEFDKLANVMGGVDLASIAVDVGGAWVGGAAISSTVKPAAKIVVKETVEEVAEGVSKKIVKEGAEEIAEGITKKISKEGAEEIAEGITKKIAKEGTEEIAEGVSKKIAKEGTEEIAEGVSKNVVNGNKIVKTTITTTSKNTLSDSIEKAGKVGKIALAEGVALTASNRFLNGKTVSDASMHGLPYAVGDATKDTLSLVTDVAEDVTVGTVQSGFNVCDSWLSKHPVLARFVNTCKSAYYASTKSFTNNKVGALAVATVSKPLDKVKSFISSSSEKYEGMSINEMANQFKEESTRDNKKWTDHYVERVKELDAELGLDSSTRSLVAREDSVSSDVELGAT